MNQIVFVSQESPERQQQWLTALRAQLPQEQIVLPDAATAAEVDLAIVANPNPDELQRFLPLKWVQSLWAGVDAMVADPRFARFNIVKLSDPQLAQTMAESVLAWTLYLHKNMPQYAAQQAKQHWQPLPCAAPADYPVTILGAGPLAVKSVAMLQRFGFNALCWSRRPKSDFAVPHIHGEAALTQRLATTKVLISLLPLTPQTKHFVNRELLQHLPAQANVINFSRGAVVDTEALLIALSGDALLGDTASGDTSHLAHAVLDVFEQEPLPNHNPLWTHPKVTVLPHISAPTSIESAATIAATNIRRFREIGEVPAAVDLGRGY